MNWNSEGMEDGYLQLEFRRHQGFQIWDFQRVQTSVFCGLPFSYSGNKLESGHLTGCGGADPHNSPTSTS